MKVALTGATGFVGQHVLAALLRRGIRPTLLLRPSSTLEVAPPGCAVERFDLTTPPDDAFARLGAPDVLLHLAWGGLPNYRAASHNDVELPGHLAFLHRMIEGGLGALVVTGTCLEYGLQEGVLDEGTKARPTTPYAEAKNELRLRLEALRADHPFHFTWARLFYMYGEGQSPRSLLPLLEAAVERGEPTFAMSGGEQVRDYLPVQQVAELLVRLSTTERGSGVVNVCSGEPITVRELVERTIAERGWSIRPDLGRYPYPDYEPMRFWGDRSKLDRCLGGAQ